MKEGTTKRYRVRLGYSRHYYLVFGNSCGDLKLRWYAGKLSAVTITV